MNISFIIPVYNCEQYIEQCVDSIEKIKLDSYEIILVDDGSPDGAGVICDSLAKSNTNIICVHQENQGVSSARNNGLAIASGEYVVFVDSDDSIDSSAMRELINDVQMDATVDIACFGMSFDYYHNSNCYRSDYLLPPLSGKYGKSIWLDRIDDLFFSNSLSSSVNKIFKKELLMSSSIRFEQSMFLYEDLEFVLRALACADNVLFWQSPIYHYRQSEDEGNALRRIKKVSSVLEVVNPIEDALNCLVKQSADEQVKAIILNLYLTLLNGKIHNSTKAELYQLSKELEFWLNEKSIVPNDYASDQNCRLLALVLNKQFFKMKIMRLCTAVRHKIAVFVKNTAIYQMVKNRGKDGK